MSKLTVEQYVTRLIQAWVQSEQYHHKVLNARARANEYRPRNNSRARKKARYIFLGISLAIVLGCNVFEHTSQSVAFESGNAYPYILAYILKCLGVVLYMVLNTSDPGFVPLQASSPSPTEQKRGDYCHSCCGMKPQRAKHCRQCNRCVARFDHHCPFVGNCIGAKNHRLFVIFLAVEWVPAMASLRICFSLFDNPTSHAMFFARLLFSIFVFCFALFDTILLGQQAFNVLAGQTTFEYLLRNRIIRYSKLHSKLTGQAAPQGFTFKFLCCRSHAFDQGVVRNVLAFFCSKTNKRWMEYDPAHRNWFHLVPSVPKKKKDRKEFESQLSSAAADAKANAHSSSINRAKSIPKCLECFGISSTSSSSSSSSSSATTGAAVASSREFDLEAGSTGIEDDYLDYMRTFIPRRSIAVVAGNQQGSNRDSLGSIETKTDEHLSLIESRRLD